MDEDTIRKLLISLNEGQISVDKALDRLRNLPYEDIGVAKVDHHRE